ncbi:MAG: glucose 1-dehydrogenase [Chloroflexi bacterium]|nr:glucose 1-dehydrogenase [Chloroflexota bacterium]
MTTPNFNLDGKVALITGASRGIGQAIAETFAGAGAKVVLASRKQAGLDAVAEKIKAAGGDALPIAAHTGDQDAVDNLLDQVTEAYSGVDILVNNAGTNPHFGPILTADEGQWAKILDVNLVGYFRVAKASVKSMRARGGGKIINMASVAGDRPAAGMGVYCVSKAGVLMLTKVLASELGTENIQVNAISPGFVKTRFSQAIWDNPQINDAVVKTIPQRRMAEPEEISGAALYLASEASAFTTGANFVLDGGQLVGSPVQF